MRYLVLFLPALVLSPLRESPAQPEWDAPAAFASAWPEIAFPLPRVELASATTDALVALAVVADLREPLQGVIADATLVLNPQKIQNRPLTFYLNPGLTIQRLSTTDGIPLGFEREESAVRLGPLTQAGEEPFTILALRYGGTLDASSSLFDPSEPSEAILGEHLSFLPAEALWYPWMPGQNATGRLRVISRAGMSAWASAAEATIIELDGQRTTDFVWHQPVRRLAVALSDWEAARVQRNQLVLEMVVPPELVRERSLLYTLTFQKVDFYGRAFYPLPWERLNLFARPDEGAPGDARGMLVLPHDKVAVHLLGHPLLDRLLARQWFGELLQFDPRQEMIEQGWTEFAARMYLESLSNEEARGFWAAEGRWLTRHAEPEVPWHFKVPWILRLIESRLGRAAFWELNQEFFQRHLYQQVRMADYLDLAEEILAEEPPGDRLWQVVQPWFQDLSIPVLAYSAQVIDSSPPQVVVQINQQTDRAWQLALELSLEPAEPARPFAARRETVFLQDATQSFRFTVPARAVTVRLDPEWRVLCKRTLVKGRPGEERPATNRDLGLD